MRAVPAFDRASPSEFAVVLTTDHWLWNSKPRSVNSLGTGAVCFVLLADA